MSGLLKDIPKGLVESLPPLSFPSAWSKKDPVKRASPRSRSQSPIAARRNKEHDTNLDESELASEEQKMRLRVLMMEHPDVVDTMKALPSLPKEMPLEMLEAKKLQFAAELSKAVPMDLVLMALALIAKAVEAVIRTIYQLNTDVGKQYEGDEALQKSMRTQLALYLGDWLTSHTLMAFKLFIVHPWAAIKEGTPLAPPTVAPGSSSPLGATGTHPPRHAQFQEGVKST